MSKEELKQIVHEYVKVKGHVTYVELERIFKENGFDYEGDLAQSTRQNPKVFFWIGWNDEAIDIIHELEVEGKIHKIPSSVLFYMADGKVLTLPIVKSNRVYKTERWCPVAFNSGKGN